MNLSFAQVHEIKLNKKRHEVKSISKVNSGYRLSFTQEKIYNKTIAAKNGSSYTEIWFNGSYPNGEVGTPKLPVYNKLIRIPKGSIPSIKISSSTEQIIDLKSKGIYSPLYPNQPSVRKDQDTTTVKFEFKEAAYQKNTFKNLPLATIEVLGNLRSASIARIVIQPVDYNPSSNLLKVSNDIDVDVSFDKSINSNDEQDFDAKTYSPYFNDVYKSIETPSQSSYTDHPDLTKYPVKMLIISNRMFEQTLQPFIQWKKLIGFNVNAVYTDEIGTTPAEIKTYIQQEYNSATLENPAPSFLIIVGDVGQVAASATSSETGRLTDLYYASVDGDMFPDMYYGRLSATTTTQLENILTKILYYEKYQFADPTYLNNVTLIAGADGTWNPRVAQPTIKYGTANYFNSSHGFNLVNEYGVTSDPNNSSANSGYTGCYGSDKISAGFINYTAHGSETSWIDPALSNSSVTSFSNTNKYPLVIGNCCLTGDFGTSECLGEAWIRAQNKGAVTYIGSSPNSYWLEDFYWAVGAFPMVGYNENGYVPTYDESTTGAYDAPFTTNYVTTGAIVFAGNLAVTEAKNEKYSNESTISPKYYWEAYNILGDPSLMPYFTEAGLNQVYHNQTITTGEAAFTVSALANSYIAISKDNQLLGTAYVETTGDVNIAITPISSTGDVIIAVTRPQTKPVIDTITAISPTGPFLKLDSYEIDDHLANNNGLADYNETFKINLQVKNIGVENATNVKVKVLGGDSYITIQGNDSISIADISYNNGSNIASVDNAFSFKVSENVLDQHTSNLSLKFYSDQGTWASSLRIHLNSPVLSYGEFKIDDGLIGGNNDSLLSPGESCKALIGVKNTGHAVAKDISLQVHIPDSLKNDVSVNNIITEPFSLEANSLTTVPFRVSINPSVYKSLIIPVTIASSVVEPSGLSKTFEKDITVYPKNSFNISNDTLTTCFTYFYDSGGKDNNYLNSEKDTTTIVASDENSLLKVSFLEFSTESGYDYLYVYDGPNTNCSQVTGSPFCGSTIPKDIISSGRCLTFRFISDGADVYKGWVATIECIEPQIPDCISSTIPADGAQKVQSRILSWTPSKFASFYDVYLGLSPTNLALAGRVYKSEFRFSPEKNKTYYWQIVPGNYLGLNNSNCNTWSFTSDTISCIVMSTNTVDVDTLLFYDSGGALSNYKNNENYTLTLKPKYSGDSLKAQFLAFNTEASYDKLYIYNGLTSSSPIIGTYSGTNSPEIVQATNSDGALTFVFHSDVSYVYSGWKAIISSIGNATFKTITCKVENNSTPISNATVNIGGRIKNTDISGYAYITVPQGDVSLTVNAEGYKSVNKFVPESETNTTINVELQKFSKINVHISDSKTQNPIPNVKIEVDADSSLTNSAGDASLALTPGTYTFTFHKEGFLPFSQQVIVNDVDMNFDISLTAIKHKVSFVVSDAFGNNLDSALVSINDTTLITNIEGIAFGYFSSGDYAITISKAHYIPLSSWILINDDSITEKLYLDATTFLYNIEFTLIGTGPKSTLQLFNTDVDIFMNGLLYSRFRTNSEGKGIFLLPKGQFIYSINHEGYNPITNKQLIVDGVKNSFIDTLIQKTFSVQFNVNAQATSIQNATVTLKGYSPENTDMLGQVVFPIIGYEKNLQYTVEKDGFINASGNIDVVNPLVVNINLIANGSQIITRSHTVIFPNPTSDQLSIETDHPITRVMVVSTLGTIEMNNTFSSLNNVSISIGKLTPGVYILIIYDENSVPEKTMIIKK